MANTDKKNRKSAVKIYAGPDILRIAACAAILLYHMNLLKSGYLAVCIFFVLSGYLGSLTALRVEKFSPLRYYINRFKRLWMPLLFVTLVTVGAISLFPDIRWVNLKPETASVLLGYNNIWQINAGLDYFTDAADSPFMHMWYLGIQLQFDLIFPLFFILFKKFGDKFGKKKCCALLAVITAAFTVYFAYAAYHMDTERVYYGTDTRVFSLLTGVLLGFMQSYGLFPRERKTGRTATYLFGVYLLAACLMCIFVPETTAGRTIGMIIIGLMTCRMVMLSTPLNSIPRKIAHYIHRTSRVSYEVYLWQYPLLFIFSYIGEGPEYTLLFLLILAVLSAALHESMNMLTRRRTRATVGKPAIVTFLVLVAFTGFSVFGGVKLFTAKDHTVELDELRNQIAQNESLMEEKQAQFADQQANPKDGLDQELVTGVGDSVMLGAIKELYAAFPNGYFDAKQSRSAFVLTDILKKLDKKEVLGDVIVIGLGTNGDCGDDVRAEIMEACGDRTVFWITVTNDKSVKVNKKLKAFAENYDNLHIIDWNSYSKGHKEYFAADGIHLTAEGRKAYASLVKKSVSSVLAKAETVEQAEGLVKGQLDQSILILRKIDEYIKSETAE